MGRTVWSAHGAIQPGIRDWCLGILQTTDGKRKCVEGGEVWVALHALTCCRHGRNLMWLRGAPPRAVHTAWCGFQEENRHCTLPPTPQIVGYTKPLSEAQATVRKWRADPSLQQDRLAAIPCPQVVPPNQTQTSAVQWGGGNLPFKRNSVLQTKHPENKCLQTVCILLWFCC